MGLQSRAVFERCDAVAQVQQCVAAAPSQHVGRTASTLRWMCQSCAAAPLTVWTAFFHHGCCGPYGGVDGCSQRLLRVHLSEIFLRQVFTSSTSTIIINQGQLFTASEGA